MRHKLDPCLTMAEHEAIEKFMIQDFNAGMVYDLIRAAKAGRWPVDKTRQELRNLVSRELERVNIRLDFKTLGIVQHEFSQAVIESYFSES